MVSSKSVATNINLDNDLKKTWDSNETPGLNQQLNLLSHQSLNMRYIQQKASLSIGSARS